MNAPDEPKQSDVVAYFLVRCEFRPDQHPQLCGCIEFIATGEKVDFSTPEELARLIVNWMTRPMLTA